MANPPLINIDADLDDADWPKRRPAGMPPRKEIGLAMMPGGIPVFKAQSYNPAQPRNPAGSPEGGQWSDGGGGSPEGESHSPSGFAGVLATISQPDGGFTYSPTAGSPKTGYALSVYKGRERVLDQRDVTLAALARYARDNRDLLKQPGNYLGGWHNPEDHKVYLDVSKVVQSRAEADRLAREYHQIAYFDLANGVSIPTPHGVQ